MAKHWFLPKETDDILKECIERGDTIAGIEPASIQKIGRRDVENLKVNTGSQVIPVMAEDLPLWLYLKLGKHYYKVRNDTVHNIIFKDRESNIAIQAFWKELFSDTPEMQNCKVRHIKCELNRMRIYFSDDGEKNLSVDQNIRNSPVDDKESNIRDIENGFAAAKNKIIRRYHEYPVLRDLSTIRNKIIRQMSELLREKEEQRFGHSVKVTDATKPLDRMTASEMYYSPIVIPFSVDVPSFGSFSVAVTLPSPFECTDLKIDGNPYRREQGDELWPDLAGRTLEAALNKEPTALLEQAERVITESSLENNCRTKIQNRLNHLPLMENRRNIPDLLLRIPNFTVPDHFDIDWETGNLILKSSVATIFYSPKTKKWEDHVVYAPVILKLDQTMQEPEMQKCRSIAEELLRKYGFAGNDAMAIVRRKRGKGLLLGDAVLFFKVIKDTDCTALQEFKCDMPQMTSELYEQQLENFLSGCRSELDQQLQAKNDRAMERAKALAVHPLDAAFFLVVAANEKYITALMATKLLRGTSASKNATFEMTPECGKFNALSEDEIRDAAGRLVKEGYLYSKELRGTYGYFDILRLEKDSDKVGDQLKELLTQQVPVPECTPEAITQSIMDYKAFLTSVNEKAMAGENIMPEIICLIHSLGHREYTAYFEDEITSLLAKVSDTALPLLKMQQEETEDEDTAKIIKRIASKTRKKANENSDIE